MEKTGRKAARPRAVRQAVDGGGFRDGEDLFDPLRVLHPLIQRWRPLLIAVLSVVFLTGLVSKFLLTKWYQATATIRPKQQFGGGGGLGSLIGSIGGMGGMGGASGGDLTQSLQGGSGHDPQELISILESYAFTVTLAKRHKLAPIVLGRDAGSGKSTPLADWSLYRAMKGRFKSQFSFQSGNLTLTFSATDPATAQRILELYVDALRAKLSTQDTAEARIAVKTLSEEIETSSDPVLKRHLYDMIAAQTEREKLASAQADFAFSVIEPPIASPLKSWPSVRMFCMAAAFVSFILLSAFWMLADYYRMLKNRRTGSESEASQRLEL